MGNGSPRRALRTVATLALAFATVLPAFGKGGAKGEAELGGRNYDLRTTLEAGAPSLAPAQAEAVARMRASVPTLLATADALTGGTRTLSNATGYLTGPRSGDAEQIALDFAWENLDLLGLAAEDLDDYEVTDRVRSAQSGVTHLYLRQRHAGLPVYNGQLHVNVADDGRILSVNNLFVPRLATALNTSVPALAPEAAVAALATHLGGANLAGRPISEPQLMILPIRPGEARLVWNFNADLGNDWFDVTVDAVDGRVWTRFNWVADATYRVYEVRSSIRASPFRRRRPTGAPMPSTRRPRPRRSAGTTPTAPPAPSSRRPRATTRTLTPTSISTTPLTPAAARTAARRSSSTSRSISTSRPRPTGRRR